MRVLHTTIEPHPKTVETTYPRDRSRTSVVTTCESEPRESEPRVPDVPSPLKMGKKGPKQNVESKYEIDCPFCGSKERVHYIGPWHSPKFLIQCEETDMTLAGWGHRGAKFFSERLKKAGYDADEVVDEMKAEMRKLFAPPEKKTRVRRDAASEKVRLVALHERKLREKTTAPRDDELSKVIAEFRRDYA